MKLTFPASTLRQSKVTEFDESRTPEASASQNYYDSFTTYPVLLSSSCLKPVDLKLYKLANDAFIVSFNKSFS